MLYRRLRRPRLPLYAAVAISLALTVLVAFVTVYLGHSTDRALALGGIAFAVCTVILTELRGRESPKKLVYYIGLDDKTFNANILEGLREELSDGMPHTLKMVPPPADSADFLKWQELQLGQNSIFRAAAVVVAPCADDDRLWEAILRLMKRGVFVVVIDLEPPTEFFTIRGAAPPAFVASDFRVGGSIAGGIIANHMKASDGTTSLVCLGPDSNSAGAGRSSWLLYTLGREGVLNRTQTFTLPSWDLAAIVPGLTRCIEAHLAGGGGVIVYCGDDRIMVEIDRHFLPRLADLKDRLALVGYDGARSSNGEFITLRCAYAVATVDTNPRAQGVAAGQILRDIYDGRADNAPTRRTVSPEAVEFRPTKQGTEARRDGAAVENSSAMSL